MFLDQRKTVGVKRILACTALLLALSGCTESRTPAGSSSGDSSSTSSSPAGGEESPSGESPQLTEGSTAFTLPIGEPNSTTPPKDGAFEEISLFLTLPEGWRSEENALFTDYKTAEFLGVYPVSESTVAFARVASAEPGIDCTIAGFPTRYYHLQKEVSVGGVTGFENTLLYFIHTGDTLVEIAFYPARGMGIATQREAFEQVLATLRV